MCLYVQLEETFLLFSLERPKSPTVSCSPQSYVLENTNITCTCSTARLGQPEGYLRWITGEVINQEGKVREEQEFPAQELHSTQSLAQSDHGNTWFRCEVVWGQENITGNNYTASVGCKLKRKLLILKHAMIECKKSENDGGER